MPRQIKGKFLPFAHKVIALDIEIVKVFKNKSDQNSKDDQARQHFHIFIANPPTKDPNKTDNTKQV